MYLDKSLMFDDSLSVAAASLNFAVNSGVHYSTYSIDLWSGNSTMPAMPNPGGTPTDDIGRGAPVEVLVQVDTAFTTSASGTLKVALVSSTAANLNAETSIVVHDESEVIAAATAVAGYQFRLRAIPAGVTQRYLGLRYSVGTGNFTAGNITAGIVLDRQSAMTSL